ncbi:ESX secretion-associated protein EspG [Amycolatopsis magusensis]|uniref:ESX secretion-associated protein EspG n=1 Tax=Amycolatopsis magusensis TaxID=882444 RepID=UPI003C2EEE95
MRVPRPIVLPLAVFRQAWKWQGLGPLHPVIGIEERWADTDTQRDLENRILDGLTRAGLARNGVLSRHFKDVLKVLAEADREFYGWVGLVDSGRSAGVLVATDEFGSAVRVFRDDAHLRLDQADFDAPERSLVDSLPRVPPAPVPELRVPRSKADAVTEVTRTRRTGVHKLHAARPDRGGSRRRSAPLTVLDLAGRGRVMTFVTEGKGAEPQLTCAPGGPEALVRHLHAADSALRPY